MKGAPLLRKYSEIITTPAQGKSTTILGFISADEPPVVTVTHDLGTEEVIVQVQSVDDEGLILVGEGGDVAGFYKFHVPDENTIRLELPRQRRVRVTVIG